MIIKLIIEDLERMGVSSYYDNKDKILVIKSKIDIGYFTFIKQQAGHLIKEIKIIEKKY